MARSGQPMHIITSMWMTVTNMDVLISGGVITSYNSIGIISTIRFEFSKIPFLNTLFSAFNLKIPGKLKIDHARMSRWAMHDRLQNRFPGELRWPDFGPTSLLFKPISAFKLWRCELPRSELLNSTSIESASTRRVINRSRRTYLGDRSAWLINRSPQMESTDSLSTAFRSSNRHQLQMQQQNICTTSKTLDKINSYSLAAARLLASHELLSPLVYVHP